MTEKNDIQKLLRLKRYEQPPKGYYDNFLSEFQRRQRTEWLRKPTWRVFLSNMAERMSEFRVGTLAYASTLVAAGIISVYFLTQPSAIRPVPSLATTATIITPSTSAPIMIPANANVPVSTSGKFSPTHYVLEPRPVSHENPFEF